MPRSAVRLSTAVETVRALTPTTGDEQTRNARSLGDVGAAVVLAQPDATPDRLRTELTTLLSEPARRAAMRAAALTVGKPDAAARLADELVRLATGQR